MGSFFRVFGLIFFAILILGEVYGFIYFRLNPDVEMQFIPMMILGGLLGLLLFTINFGIGFLLDNTEKTNDLLEEIIARG